MAGKESGAVDGAPDVCLIQIAKMLSHAAPPVDRVFAMGWATGRST